MAAIGGQWGEWWTLPRLSHAVQEICQCFAIIILSLKGPTVNSLRKLSQLSRFGAFCHGVTFGFDVIGVNVLHQVVVSLKCESAGVSVHQATRRFR